MSPERSAELTQQTRDLAEVAMGVQVAAAALAFEGAGALAFYAGRVHPEVKAAAVVVVLMGRMTNDDIRRFREHCEAFNQDLAVGCRTTTAVRIDQLDGNDGGAS